MPLKRVKFQEKKLEIPPELQTIIDSVVDGFTITDLEGNILYVNAALVRMYGFESKEEIIGQSSLNFIAPRDRDRATRNIQKTLADGQMRSVEYFSVRKDRSEFPIELSVGVIKDSRGNPIGFAGITKDISQRKETENKLIQTLKEVEESQAKLNAVFNSNQISILIFNKQGVIQQFNRPAEEYTRKLLGKELKVGEIWYNFLPPRFRENARERILKVLHGQSVRFDYAITDREGINYWFDVSYQPIMVEGEIIGISLIALDITARKEYEESLEESQRQLLFLTKNLQTIQERERSRIAMDIHDDLGQKLSLLQIEIDLMLPKIARMSKQYAQQLESLSNRVKGVIEDIKRIAYELHPEIQNRDDLTNLLKWKAWEIQKSTGLNIELKWRNCEKEISPEVATALYRITCEALTNVIRHASASMARVELTCDARTVRLTVEDNGIGIAPEKIHHPDSYGIMGMFARAQALKGQVKITGKPGKGTIVQVSIPLTKEERESL